MVYFIKRSGLECQKKEVHCQMLYDYSILQEIVNQDNDRGFELRNFARRTNAASRTGTA